MQSRMKICAAAALLASTAPVLAQNTAEPVTVTPPPPAKVETPPSTQVEVTPPGTAIETPPPVQREKKTFPWRPVAISSLVVGVVGIVVGAPLVAIDGNPTCSKPNPRMSCPDVYNTLGGGATMLTLGLAGVAASGVLFYLDHRARKHATQVSVSPTVGGAAMSVSGRF